MSLLVHRSSPQAGWSLDACTSCGVNVLTDTNASDGLGLSVDMCYIPPGWGAAYTSGTKQLTAYKCNNGTYGVQERTYGVDPRPCKVCCWKKRWSCSLLKHSAVWLQQ